MDLDNEIIILLRKAKELQIPSKYIFENRNLFNEIKSAILAKDSIEKIDEKFPTIDSKTLGIIYAYMLKSRSENLLAEVNNFYLSKNIKPIRDELELNLYINDFSKKFQKDYDKDMDTLDKLENLKTELEKYPSLPYTDVKIESIVFLSTVKYDGKTPNINQGYDIFDTAVPNITVPYIKWKTNLVETSSKELYKLFKETLENQPDYTKIIPSLSFKEKTNSFTFIVWNGDLEKDNIREATKESYLKGTYNLDDNIMKIKIPIEKGKERIVNRIKDSMKLVPDKISETSITGEMFIYNIEFNDILLSHMILNYELMNIYLFVKETSSTFIEKKKNLKIHFRSSNEDAPSSVIFSIEQNYVKEDETVKLANGDNLKVYADDPYIRVLITSDSLEVGKKAIEIFSRLLNYYKSQKDELEQLYISYIPNFKTENEKSISVKKIASTKIGQLKQAAPDLFITEYARKCLQQFQPSIIQDDEIEEWRNKTFLYKGERLERQIMRFPPDNPTWNFVCPNDKYPFPGVKVNNLANKEKYKGLPCCFVNDQMSENAKSKYNKIYKEKIEEEEYEEEQIEEEDEKITHTIKTDQIIKSGRYGQLPSNIEDLLSSSKEFKNFRRKGMPRSYNSLLHCISVAVNDKKYFDTKESERERYIAKLRQTIASSTLPGLLKQEMYDFNDLEISTKLRDNSIFLDPNLFFRALEEAYNINIFVFAPSEDENKRLKNKEESMGAIELPRFKLFYSRVPRDDRLSVLIYRTMGSETNNLTFPQCELIVGEENEKERSLFKKNMFNIISTAISNISKTITWELVSSSGKDIDIIARENLYSRLNYYELTGGVATKQYIDEYGKLRGLYLPVKGEDVLMIFPSSSPVNLIVDKNIYRAHSKNVFSIITNPSGISSEESGIVDGLWFSVLDLVYGIYVPIVPEKINDNKIFQNLPIGPSNPLNETGTKVVSRTIKLKRDLDFIMQILKWLYSLTNLSLDDFLNNYVGIGDTTIKEDSSKIYNFDKIGRIFPDVKNTTEGIKEMEKRVPSLFREGRLFLYSEKFFNGIYYLLKIYVKEYEKESKIIPKIISRKYVTEQDFISHPRTALFLTDIDLRTWLTTLDKNINIFKNINILFALKSDPFIYLAPDKHIYLIQNVFQGKLERALNVNYYWKTNKINIGFKSDEYDHDDPKYVIYDISQANNIILSENHAGDTTDFFSVIRYNSYTFGAMLLLL